MSAFAQIFRSRSAVHLVFLALVVYGLCSVLWQTFRITPQLGPVNILDEHMLEGWFLPRNAVPLPPVRVFQEWKIYHSVEAMQRNPHNRTFLVGRYSCPRQAGNILHEFLSAMLQAVATNRTFLWQHHKSAYWENMGENSQEQCDRILARARWIPSYHEWNRTLALDPPVRMPHNHSHTYPDLWQRMDRGERVANDLSGYQVIQPAEKLWGLSKKPQVWRGLLLLTNNYTAKYLSQFYGMDLLHDEKVQALYSQRVSFLYGMLFRESFGFTDQFLETVSEDLYQQPGNSTAVTKPWDWKARRTNPLVYTIGLHSRHMHLTNNGSDVQNEIKCLDHALDARENDKVPCTVYIMSDRPKTIENLRTYLLQRDCSVVVATQRIDPEVNDTGKKTEEHGPFAGAGFFRDLVVVSQARSAFIGSTRSSSALVDELMEYDRRTEAWRSNNVSDSLLRCYIGQGEHRFRRIRQQNQRRRWRRYGEKLLPLHPTGLVISGALAGIVVVWRWRISNEDHGHSL
jgi:hypothetical protein